MTTVTIVPENPGAKDTLFRASARQTVSVGPTPGSALDALTERLNQGEMGKTVVVVQDLQPDEFFNASQQTRLEELRAKLRLARDAGHELDPADQCELERLLEAGLDASAHRAAAIAKELRS